MTISVKGGGRVPWLTWNERGAVFSKKLSYRVGKNRYPIQQKSERLLLNQYSILGDWITEVRNEEDKLVFKLMRGIWLGSYWVWVGSMISKCRWWIAGKCRVRSIQELWIQYKDKSQSHSSEWNLVKNVKNKKASKNGKLWNRKGRGVLKGAWYGRSLEWLDKLREKQEM